MLRLIKLMMPATNTNSINATIRTRCFSAKATTVFMCIARLGRSVGLCSAVNKYRTARHDLLPGGEAGENLDHAVAGPSRADFAQCQGVAVTGNPDARLLPLIDDSAQGNRRRRRCLSGDDAEIRK